MESKITDLPALWQQYQEAVAEAEAWCNASNEREIEDAPTWPRHMAAEEALKAARPTDSPGIAAQLGWLADCIADGGILEQDEILEHMVQALAGRSAQGAAITDPMVAAGMEAADKHRHTGAEERVRAILAAALDATSVDEEAFRLWDAYKAASSRASDAHNATDRAMVDDGVKSAQHAAADRFAVVRDAEQETAELAIAAMEPQTLPAVVIQLRLLAENVLCSLDPTAAPLSVKVLSAIERMAGMKPDPYLQLFGVRGGWVAPDRYIGDPEDSEER